MPFQQSAVANRKRKFNDIDGFTIFSSSEMQNPESDGHTASVRGMRGREDIDDAIRSCTGLRQMQLRQAYRMTFNDAVQLLDDSELDLLIQKHDDCSVLVYAAVLATGLLAESSTVYDDPEHLGTSVSKRSKLHQTVKDAIDCNETFPSSQAHALTLLLLSNLERSRGFFGAAKMYLREARQVIRQSLDAETVLDQDRQGIFSRYNRAALKLLEMWTDTSSPAEHNSASSRGSYVQDMSQEIWNEPTFELDYSSMTFGQFGSAPCDAADLPSPIGQTRTDNNLLNHENAESPASTSSRRSELDKRLDIISDPVFGAYVDEVAYIKGRSNSPKRQRRPSQETSRERISSETWKGNAIAESLRAFLGHDIGFDSPSEATEETQRDIVPPFSASMTAAF